MRKLLIFLIFFCHFQLLADDISNSLERVREIAKKAQNSGQYLKEYGPLVVMGNSSLDEAQIVLLPEVHDDPYSQIVQLLLIARERQKGKPFIVLDESLQAFEKSSWDIFSQKTMEILAAEQSRATKETYSPHRFEASLQNLATKIRTNSNQLNFLPESRSWVLSPFKNLAMPFFGWDITGGNSLAERNVNMVKSLKRAVKENDRILLMLGARHVPELEYFTSKQLLCPEDQAENIEDFFSGVEKKFGLAPDITFSIGATAPIYRYLKNQRYVLIFSKKFYRVLREVVDEFKNSSNNQNCVNL